MTLGVRESTARVMTRSRRVRVDDAAIGRLADLLVVQSATPPAWDRRYHLDARGPILDQYLFVLDTVNFSFWSDPKWRVTYSGEVLDGYWALAASLRRAVEDGTPILDAAYLSQVSAEELRRIFRGEGEIPMINERVQALQETGSVLLARYDGQAANLVQKAAGSAVAFVEELVSAFPSFNDVARYADDEVRFYKRGQILASDIASAGGEQWHDLTELTAFADYKLPQVLRAHGALSYSPDVADRVDRQVEIPAGSTTEVEIRAATVQAVERLRQALETRGRSYRSAEVDWLLWELAQRELPGGKPYHRTRTIFY